MASDGSNFVRCAAVLRKPSRSGLAQPMEAAIAKSSLVALFMKPVTESCCRKWSSELCRYERQVTTRRFVQDRPQLWEHRNEKIERCAMGRLFPDPVYDPLCQWRWLDHASGGNMSKFRPNCVNPAALPS